MQIHDCNLLDNGTSNVAAQGTREEAFTQRIQFFTVLKLFSIVMEQRGHLVMTCPFLLEELQGAAGDYLINGKFQRFLKQYTKRESSEAVLFNRVFFIHTGNQVCGDQKYLIGNWKIMRNHINCFLLKIPCCGFFFMAHCLGRIYLAGLLGAHLLSPLLGRMYTLPLSSCSFHLYGFYLFIFF